MKVIEVKEHEDGSATVQFDITPEETKQLVEFALQRLIKEFVNELPKGN